MGPDPKKPFVNAIFETGEFQYEQVLDDIKEFLSLFFKTDFF